MNSEIKNEVGNLNGSPRAGVKDFEKVMKEVLDLGKTCENQFKTFTK